VIAPTGYVYALEAFPICAAVPEGSATDVDGDGRLDFDDIEYGSLPDTLFIHSFVALGEQPDPPRPADRTHSARVAAGVERRTGSAWAAPGHSAGRSR